jgi:hypothetical protein
MRSLAHLGGFLLATSIALPSPVAAQTSGETGTITEDIVNCASIADDGQRLSCFDRSVAQLLGQGAGQGEDAALEFVGEDGSWTSDVVTIDRKWHIVWQSTAVQMTVELRSAEDHLLSVAATQVGEGSGQSSPFDPGAYRLNVRAVNGEWRLLVIEE